MSALESMGSFCFGSIVVACFFHVKGAVHRSSSNPRDTFTLDLLKPRPPLVLHNPMHVAMRLPNRHTSTTTEPIANDHLRTQLSS